MFWIYGVKTQRISNFARCNKHLSRLGRVLQIPFCWPCHRSTLSSITWMTSQPVIHYACTSYLTDLKPRQPLCLSISFPSYTPYLHLFQRPLPPPLSGSPLPFYWWWSIGLPKFSMWPARSTQCYSSKSLPSKAPYLTSSSLQLHFYFYFFLCSNMHILLFQN